MIVLKIPKAYDYLRGNLSALDSGILVPFESELGHVKTYLKIEQVRFGERVKVAYDIQTMDFKLPVLTIEPLVENAVKHGVCPKTGGGTVTILARELPEAFQVCVEDDGVGFDASSFNWNKVEQVGLRSVKERIELLCSGKLSIESKKGEGTRAILTIPKTKEES